METKHTPRCQCASGLTFNAAVKKWHEKTETALKLAGAE